MAVLVLQKRQGLQLATALETERLLMRGERLEDADAYYAYRSKQSYWQHLPMEPPSHDQIVAQIARFLPQQTADSRRFYFWAVVEKTRHQVIGEASLMLLPDRGARIGFSLSEHCWRLGYGTEIARQMLAFAFQSLDRHRVEAHVMPANTGSIRIMSKVGMQHEGVLRQLSWARGVWWDLAQYSILDTEFNSGR